MKATIKIYMINVPYKLLELKVQTLINTVSILADYRKFHLHKCSITIFIAFGVMSFFNTLKKRVSVKVALP